MNKPKILVIHNNVPGTGSKHSAVHEWRLARPIRELKKHVDWQIDERPSIIPQIEKYKDKTEFTPEEMEKAYNDIASYDIVWSSYQTNPTVYTLLKVAEEKAGTQYIMDIDDNLFAINPDNPVWTMVKDEHIYFMQCMARDNKWISTTTETLAGELRKRRGDKDGVLIAPNFISDDYKAYTPDNGDKIVIGYFGGASHYKDIHNTGFLPALQRVMHEHKNVYFKSVGMIVDHYLPRQRMEIVNGKMGDAWTNEIFPSLNFDISVAPLLDNGFNQSKSDIKWQESTRMGAAFVCSDIGAYKELSDALALKTNNTEDEWYKALKSVIEDVEVRKTLVDNSNHILNREHRLETHWARYKEMFSQVYTASKITEYATV